MSLPLEIEFEQSKGNVGICTDLKNGIVHSIGLYRNYNHPNIYIKIKNDEPVTYSEEILSYIIGFIKEEDQLLENESYLYNSFNNSYYKFNEVLTDDIIINYILSSPSGISFDFTSTIICVSII